MNDTTHVSRLRRDDSGHWLRLADQRRVVCLLVTGLVVLAVSSWYGGSKRLDEPDVAGERVEFLVDVNRAGLAELALLPGIGPTLAQRIIRSRSEDGWFDSPGQLQRVHGIGPKKVEQMASYLFFLPRPQGHPGGRVR